MISWGLWSKMLVFCHVLCDFLELVFKVVLHLGVIRGGNCSLMEIELVESKHENIASYH
jgi:hypothetical protein